MSSTSRVMESGWPSGCSLASVLVLFVPSLWVREIDFRQDFDHRSSARLDNPDVVLCVEATIPEPEDGPALTPLAGRLREREYLQIMLFVLTQSV